MFHHRIALEKGNTPRTIQNLTSSLMAFILMTLVQTTFHTSRSPPQPSPPPSNTNVERKATTQQMTTMFCSLNNNHHCSARTPRTSTPTASEWRQSHLISVVYLYSLPFMSKTVKYFNLRRH